MGVDFKRVAAIAAAGALAASAVACSSSSATDSGSKTYYGDSLDLGKGKVKTFETTIDGKPSAVGFVFDASVLDGLPGPEAAHDMQMVPSTHLAVPKDAPATAVDFATFDFAPAGHEPPGIFDIPHFDVHFYTVPSADVMTAVPSNPNFAAAAAKDPDPKYVPQDYGLGPIPRAEVTIPLMGVHTFDLTTPLIPGQYKFTEILINGRWDGKTSFIEPMITLDFLKSKPSLEKDLKLPQAYQKDAYYPTKYKIAFDADKNQYVVALTGMVQRSKS